MALIKSTQVSHQVLLDVVTGLVRSARSGGLFDQKGTVIRLHEIFEAYRPLTKYKTRIVRKHASIETWAVLHPECENDAFTARLDEALWVRCWEGLVALCRAYARDRTIDWQSDDDALAWARTTLPEPSSAIDRLLDDSRDLLSAS